MLLALAPFVELLKGSKILQLSFKEQVYGVKWHENLKSLSTTLDLSKENCMGRLHVVVLDKGEGRLLDRHVS